MARDRVVLAKQVFRARGRLSDHEMASSPSLPQVEEPVLQDSLSYWEKQKATYDGVLGVCGCLSHVSLAHQSFHHPFYPQPGQVVMALAYALFLYLSDRPS